MTTLHMTTMSQDRKTDIAICQSTDLYEGARKKRMVKYNTLDMRKLAISDNHVHLQLTHRLQMLQL
jgi:hypothetical protein